ncbi:glycoside hydrolase family 43 [Aquabacterium olei]|uniref:Glycoside hydrolase family 43 n=1 Tax=Aquabacterium olei TaxID=1296669 RepID=A0A2U8FRT5_9BURK|nr:HlyD family efflux transporter periplasmic adaptor subunit [Aquabacterium olei]AWI53775.1 glycoside hydrolase family 43 [Aquabacterium olei]
MSSPQPPRSRLRILALGAAAAVVVGGFVAWQGLQPEPLPAGIASGNGRLEGTEIDVAARTGGRVKAVLVQEGDDVEAGQAVAEMDTDTLQADLRRAQAQLAQSRQAAETAEALQAQRQQAIATAEAVVGQRQAEVSLAARQLERARELVAKGFLPPQQLDQAQAAHEGARAALGAARSQVAEARAALTTLRSQRAEAGSAIEAAQAAEARVQADLADTVLRAPRGGRVQVKAAQPGEVLGGGARVLSLVDLSDVYMTFFLPEAAAGRLALGAEARLVLDAAPQYVIPASVSYVASVAQFTPKTVETHDERQKLVFKVRARIDPALLARYRNQVKTGMPGMAYVRVDSQTPWPARLAVALPPERAPALPASSASQP